eukprot:COSAG01_NODE_5073_length_4506_cov_3.537781_3_plen_81_part_00
MSRVAGRPWKLAVRRGRRCSTYDVVFALQRWVLCVARIEPTAAHFVNLDVSPDARPRPRPHRDQGVLSLAGHPGSACSAS